MWAAVRYRGVQSVILVLLNALVCGFAGFAPLFTRSLEQGTLRVALTRMDPSERTIGATWARGEGTEDQLLLDDLREPSPQLARFVGTPVGSVTASVSVPVRAGAAPSPARLMAWTDSCPHLVVVSGRCPTGDGEVMVSDADSRHWGWRPGSRLSLMADQQASLSGVRGNGAYRVVGVYRPRPDPAYWGRTTLVGVSGVTIPVGADSVAGVDVLLTSVRSFESTWPRAAVTVTYPLRESEITLDTIAAAARSTSSWAPTTRDGVAVSTPLPAIGREVARGRQIVALVVPLLLAQAALLAGAVLVLVASATVAQRRPELALARLRGRSREGARRLLLGELGWTAALGLLLGAPLALGLSELVRRRVLPAGVPFEVSWSLPVGLLGGLAASLLALAVVTRPTINEPVVGLLRRTPASVTQQGVPLLEVVLLVLAALGIVGVLSGSVSGPFALALPTLFGLTAGIVAGRLLGLVLVHWGRGRLLDGRPSSGLAALSIGRRPALRHLVVVVTAAAALVAFAVDALSIVNRNQGNRARLEVGAPAVLATDATNGALFLDAVRRLPPEVRDHVTPVGRLGVPGGRSVTTLAVRPEQLRRIAWAPPQQPDVETSRVKVNGVPSLILSGRRVRGTLTYDFAPSGPNTVRLGISVDTGAQQLLDRDLVSVPASGSGRTRIDAPLLCPTPCRLAQVWVQLGNQFGDPVSGRILIEDLSVDGRALPGMAAPHWQPPEVVDTRDGSIRATDSGGGLRVAFTSRGARLALTYADVPVRFPAIVSGVPAGGDLTIQSLGGLSVPARVVQTVPALPSVPGRGALVDLDSLVSLGSDLPAWSTLEVWVDGQDAPLLTRVSESLRSVGIRVTSVRTTDERQDVYRASATGWSFLLCLLLGITALTGSVGVLLVVVLANWRTTARDLAALELAGLERRETRRWLLVQQAAPLGVGAVLGTGCAVVGVWLAMPLVPLFDDHPSLPAPDLRHDWVAIAAASALVVVALVLVSWFLGRTVVGRATYDRLRETL